MKTLYENDRGAYVSYVQLALDRAGYDLAVDGIFGQQTCNALRRFLGTENCTVDDAAWQKLAPYLKGYTLHTVEAGDTFFRLLDQYSTTLTALQQANPGVNAMQPEAGTELVIPFRFDVVATNVPYSYELMEWILEGLRVRYPFVEQETIGQSIMGKNIPCVKIGSGEKRLSYNASFHANEWICTPLLLKFAEDYLKAYSAGGRLGLVPARELYDSCTLCLIPMVNPDGVDLVTGTLDDPAYRRAAEEIASAYPEIPFPDGWKANIAGVDLNLQFPAGWEQAREIKYALGFTAPAPRDYVGDAPLSAPESRAMYEYTMANDFSLILAYHTQGEVIYWKYLDYEPAGALELGQYFSRVSGYALEVTPLVSGYAGYKDWFIMQYNRPGYTIEAGRGTNPLPLSQFDEMYEDNFGIWIGAMFFDL
ncbi:MAG: LysM peptidoglycan-binding domain-containing protein [Lachnospiraceae bacterium]|nr:LysM peptidoglycan-binding domain-containing protein [Lachnospiraceae bacterium]